MHARPVCLPRAVRPIGHVRAGAVPVSFMSLLFVVHWFPGALNPSEPLGRDTSRVGPLFHQGREVGAARDGRDARGVSPVPGPGVTRGGNRRSGESEWSRGAQRHPRRAPRAATSKMCRPTDVGWFGFEGRAAPWCCSRSGPVADLPVGRPRRPRDSRLSPSDSPSPPG